MKAFAQGLLLVVFITEVVGQDNPSSLIAKFDCPDRVSSVAFSSDGKLLAAGYGWRNQGGLTVWNVSDRTIARSWKAEKEGDDTEVIRQIAFSPDGKLLAAATWHGDLLLWELDHWGPKKALKTDVVSQFGSPSGLAFNGESGLLPLSGNKAVIVYDVRTGKQQQFFSSSSPIGQPIAAGFLPDSKTLLICPHGSTFGPVLKIRVLARISRSAGTLTAHLLVAPGTTISSLKVRVFDGADQESCSRNCTGETGSVHSI